MQSLRKHSSISVNQLHGQLLLLGIPSTALSSVDVALYKKIQPSGFIIFSRNIESPLQLRKLTDDLRELVPFEPIIAIDQEGGRVTRTKDIAPILPSAVDLAAHGDVKKIATAGMLTGQMLRYLGCNLNFAPVLDIDHFPSQQNSLRGRCWGTDSQRIIDYAENWNRWHRKQGVLTCAKHFPSCGLATSDPHHDLPIAQASADDLLKNDILPYTALMPELDAIMTSHVRFPLLDHDHPASLSPKIIKKFLRDQLGFDKQLVITDDLDMAAVMQSYGRGADAAQAISAGNDLAMICHHLDTAEAVTESLKSLPHHQVDDALKRIENFRKKLSAPYLWNDSKWQKLCGDVQKLSDSIPAIDQGGSNSPVAMY